MLTLPDGHNYLDKKALVHITLGHPNTSRAPFPAPVRLSDTTGRGQHPSLKLVMAPKPDSVAIPHSVILPLSDEREVFAFQVDSFDTFSLEFDLFPTFGSKVIGKGVALPSTFSNLQSQGSYIVPLLDPHLKVIGDIPFEVNVVKPFERAQLQLGGQFETYWKSTTTIAADGEPTPTLSGAGNSVVTASSLSGEHVRVIVQVTSDGFPVAYPQWKLPVEGFDVHVGEVTSAQFHALAKKLGKTLDPTSIADKTNPASWYQAVLGAMVSLDELLRVRTSLLMTLTDTVRCCPRRSAWTSRCGTRHDRTCVDCDCTTSSRSTSLSTASSRPCTRRYSPARWSTDV